MHFARVESLKGIEGVALLVQLEQEAMQGNASENAVCAYGPVPHLSDDRPNLRRLQKSVDAVLTYYLENCPIFDVLLLHKETDRCCQL